MSVARSLLFALLLPAVAAAQSDLVNDGSFDDPTLSQWGLAVFDDSTVDWSDLDVDGSPTSGSARVIEDGDSGPANTVFLIQAVSVVPGSSYTVTGRYRLPTQTTSGDPLFRIEWRETYFAVEGYLPSCGGDESPQTDGLDFSTVQEVWHTLDLGVLVAPERASCASIQVGAAFAGTGETVVVHWDDVRFVPEPDATLAAALAALAIVAARREQRAARAST